jgi:hypothetical protein
VEHVEKLTDHELRCCLVAARLTRSKPVVGPAVLTVNARQSYQGSSWRQVPRDRRPFVKLKKAGLILPVGCEKNVHQYGALTVIILLAMCAFFVLKNAIGLP